MKEEHFRATLALSPTEGDDGGPDFVVVGFEGIEEISRTYCFELDLESEDPGIDVRLLLHREATLVIEYGGRRVVHGIISAATQSGKCRSGRYAYGLHLVPAMAKLGLSRQSQIYGTAGPVNVIDVVEMELTGRSAEGARDISSAHIDPKNLEIRVPRDQFPSRDYIVQYQESNLAFVCRLLEQRGIFFFFDHSGTREKLILGDHNASFDVLQGNDGSKKPRLVEYKPPATDSVPGLSTVHSMQRRCLPLPEKLILREQNYRSEPGARRNPEYLHVEDTVEGDGYGVHVSYDEQFKDPAEGRELWTARAEAMRCRQEVFSGTSNCCQFNDGHQFELKQHFNKAFNQTYLITQVRHKGGARLGEEHATYRNTFTAIPASVAYRPECLTPKPVVPGVFTAYVDAAGSGLRAAIDDAGHYKIRLPFDLSGAGDGMASRFMRMAQPYANFSSAGGANAGMHFPLLKGTEVVCACVNGNPDRPIILSAIPNPRTKSPVTSENAGQNRIRTTSGILMEFDDGSPRSNE